MRWHISLLSVILDRRMPAVYHNLAYTFILNRGQRILAFCLLAAIFVSCSSPLVPSFAEDHPADGFENRVEKEAGSVPRVAGVFSPEPEQ
jgi:hypothetical protein